MALDRKEDALVSIQKAIDSVDNLLEREDYCDIGEVLLGSAGEEISYALQSANSYISEYCSESDGGELGEKPIPFPKDLLKSYVGFDTKVIKRGAVFYVNIVDNRQDFMGLSKTLLPSHATIHGNAFISSATSTRIELQTVGDIIDRMAWGVDLHDIQDGIVRILEFRELK